MATFTNTWYHDLNRSDANPLTSAAAANQTEQYQNAALNFKRFLTGVAPAQSSGAWTVTASSNGTTANSSDNWSAPADITFASSGARSWIVLNNTTLGVWVTLECFNSAADATPTDVRVYIARVAPTGGSTSAVPTSTAGSSALSGRIVMNTSTFTPNTFHGWRNNVGEFWCVFSEDGTSQPDCVIGVARFINGSNTQYNTGIYTDFSSTTGGGAAAIGQLANVANWRGFTRLGTPTAQLSLTTPATAWSSWANGVDETGEVHHAYGDMSFNTTSSGSFQGQFVDVRFTATQLPSNTDFLPDADPTVRKSIGGLALPTPTSTGLTL